MDHSRAGGRLRALRDRIMGEPLADTRQGDGTYALTIGIVCGLIWLFLAYVLPGRSGWDTRFLVVAVCFVAWGVADILPRGWLIVAAFLRAAVLLFLLAFGAWVLFGLFAAS